MRLNNMRLQPDSSQGIAVLCPYPGWRCRSCLAQLRKLAPVVSDSLSYSTIFYLIFL